MGYGIEELIERGFGIDRGTNRGQARNNWSYEYGVIRKVNHLPGVIIGATEGVDCIDSQGDAIFDVPVIPRFTPLSTRVDRPETFDRSARREPGLMGAII